jgi:hypothetical protein
MPALVTAVVLASLVAARAPPQSARRPAPAATANATKAAAAPRSVTPRPAASKKAVAVKRAGAGPRARLVAAARRQVGTRFRGDCSAFVRHVYRTARVPLPTAKKARSGTEAIVRSLAPARRPRPGDIAYFHRTHDRDPPGKGRNLYTHIGVVEAVRGQRVTVVHKSNRGVERLTMHLGRRADPRVNDALRRKRASDPPGQRYLGSQLLAGFATPFGSEARAARRVRVSRANGG